VLVLGEKSRCHSLAGSERKVFRELSLPRRGVTEGRDNVGLKRGHCCSIPRAETIGRRKQEAPFLVLHLGRGMPLHDGLGCERLLKRGARLSVIAERIGR